jgi:ATP adenylyltransferase
MTHLWTPWRSTYMKEQKKKGLCVFCEAATGASDQDSLVVYRGQGCFVILNRYPYTSGHIMVAPYSHVSRLNMIDDCVATEIMSLARFAEKFIEETYSPDGLNLGMNLGQAAGAGIEEHIHMHVLPRWRGDANFMTSVADTRIIPEALSDTYERLHAAFSHLHRD